MRVPAEGGEGEGVGEVVGDGDGEYATVLPYKATPAAMPGPMAGRP